MIKKITYENKVSIQNDPNVAEINKVTDKNMNEIKEVVNTNADKQTAMEAEQTSQNTELEELRAENERLNKDINALPSGTAEGESIDLKDSAEMRFSGFEISGNSRQETRSGKNLLKTKTVDSTTNGITVKVNEDKSITLNGTSTSQVVISIGSWGDITLQGKYIFSSGNILPTGVSIQNWYDSGTLLNAISPNNNYTILNVSEEKTYTSFRSQIVINSGITLSNFVLKFMLEKTEEDTPSTYEQYGASPSPDYLSEIESCGDNVNLFTGKMMYGEYNQTTGKYINNENAYCNSNNEIMEIKKGNIIISQNQIPKTARFFFYDIDKNFITSILAQGVSVEVPENARYANFQIEKTELTSFGNIKVEQNKTPTPYSKYGQGCINEVVCNGNLLNEKELLEMYPSIISSTTYEGIECYKIMGAVFSFKLKRNYNKDTQYAFQFKYIGKTNESIGTFQFVYDDGTTSDITYSGHMTEKGKVYSGISTKGKNVKTIQWGAWSSGHCIYVAKDSIQIEEGTKTDYIPHKSQTFSIPTQQPMLFKDDYFDWDNEEEVHGWENVVLDGTETIKLSDGRFEITSKKLNAQSNVNWNSILLISNYFEGATFNALKSKNNRVSYHPYDLVISIYSTDFTTIDELTLFLTEQYNAGTPVHVWYKLEKETRLPFTEEQKVVAKEIKNAKSYKGVTHMYSTDKVSSNKKVTYKKDLETMINNLNTALIAMGGV